MATMLEKLSLLMITVIALTSSQPTVDHATQQDSDVSSCGSNDQVLSQLVTSVSQLITSNSQIHAAVSQLTTTVSQLQTDVAELKTGSRQANASGKQCYFSSKYNFNIFQFLIQLVDHNFNQIILQYF